MSVLGPPFTRFTNLAGTKYSILSPEQIYVVMHFVPPQPYETSATVVPSPGPGKALLIARATIWTVAGNAVNYIESADGTLLCVCESGSAANHWTVGCNFALEEWHTPQVLSENVPIVGYAGGTLGVTFAVHASIVTPG